MYIPLFYSFAVSLLCPLYFQHFPLTLTYVPPLSLFYVSFLFPFSNFSFQLLVSIFFLSLLNICSLQHSLTPSLYIFSSLSPFIFLSPLVTQISLSPSNLLYYLYFHYVFNISLSFPLLFYSQSSFIFLLLLLTLIPLSLYSSTIPSLFPVFSHFLFFNSPSPLLFSSVSPIFSRLFTFLTLSQLSFH